MNKYLTFTVSLMAFLSITLVQAETDKPSVESILKTLQGGMPPGAVIQRISPKATDHVGSKIEPKFQMRFEAPGITTESIYTQTGRIENVNVVEQVVPKGFTFTLYGISTSTLNYGKWQTYFENLHVQPEFDGFVLSHFGKSVIKDSPEHVELKAEHNKLVKKREQQVRLKLLADRKRNPDRQAEAKKKAQKRKQQEKIAAKKKADEWKKSKGCLCRSILSRCLTES
jgi:hypothetical protein